jgi:hypothetical protein
MSSGRCWNRCSTRRQARAEACLGPAIRGERDAVHLPHRLPVAHPARGLLPLDAGVVAVPPLVSQRRVGPCSQGPALRRATLAVEPNRSVDGGNRPPPGSRRVERRIHLPRPRRPLRRHKGREASNRLRCLGFWSGTLVDGRVGGGGQAVGPGPGERASVGRRRRDRLRSQAAIRPVPNVPRSRP